MMWLDFVVLVSMRVLVSMQAAVGYRLRMEFL